jgi:hypothetical protein
MPLTRIVLGTLIASSLWAAETPAPAPAEPAPAAAPARTEAGAFGPDGVHSISLSFDGPGPAPTPVPVHAAATFGLSGVHFGGIIGGSLETTLAVMPDWPLVPELGASLGVSGTKFSLGARWPLGERHWVLGRGTGPIAIEAATSLTPRLIACYRWEDREREPDFWRGIANDDGWYLGGEMGVTWYGLDLDIAVTWRDGGGPRTTLAYGFSF